MPFRKPTAVIPACRWALRRWLMRCGCVTCTSTRINPHWANRDRFILSAGHGSMLLYSLLYLTGFDVSLDDIKNFRQWESITPGHPEYGVTPGVETTTGPLGQGAGNAVGMALAEAYPRQIFQPPRSRDCRSLHLRAGRRRRPDGRRLGGSGVAGGTLGTGQADLPVRQQPRHARRLGGHDLHRRCRRALSAPMAGRRSKSKTATTWRRSSNAIEAAKEIRERPTLIVIKTIIGYGSPNKGGTSEAHGSPLGADEIKLVKEFYGWPQEDFYVPGEALEHFREAIDRGAAWEADWNDEIRGVARGFPRSRRGVGSARWRASCPTAGTPICRPTARRSRSPRASRPAKSLNAIAKHIPTMIGGDADLAGSTRTLIKGAANTGSTTPRSATCASACASTAWARLSTGWRCTAASSSPTRRPS